MYDKLFKLGTQLAIKYGEKQKTVISPTEDLMREHGALNRLLLVYEEALNQLKLGKDIPNEALRETARIIQKFIEDYHEESLEEGFVFPKLKKAGQLIDLIKLLIVQHNESQKLTDFILKIKKNNNDYIEPICKFLRMYRPHEAREDTVIFPAYHKLLTAQELQEIGEQFEEIEHKIIKDGYTQIIKSISEIEKEFGIYDLTQFTP